MVRINFQPYTTPQLEAIVHARLERAKASLQAAKGEDKDGEEEDMSGKEVIARDGVRFAAMKVSSISGDARRVLDICRCVRLLCLAQAWHSIVLTHARYSIDHIM